MDSKNKTEMYSEICRKGGIKMNDFETTKHFAVSISANSTSFTFECGTAHQAYEAITNASDVFGIDLNMDEVMQVLCCMKKGIQIAWETCELQIFVRDGEV